MGITFVSESVQVTVPDWVRDLESFRRWVGLDEVPEKLKVWYFQGEILVDVCREPVFSHVALKGMFTVVLGGLVRETKAGYLFGPGVTWSNVRADFSGKPDALFVANASLDERRVRFVEDGEGGYDEIEGSPEMVLEVVGPSSVHKDNVVLRKLYWEAGVQEYWLVDARKEPLSFAILQSSPGGYVATRNRGGWLRSKVFAKSFQLSAPKDGSGYPEYTLSVR